MARLITCQEAKFQQFSSYIQILAYVFHTFLFCYHPRFLQPILGLMLTLDYLWKAASQLLRMAASASQQWAMLRIGSALGSIGTYHQIRRPWLAIPNPLLHPSYRGQVLVLKSTGVPSTEIRDGFSIQFHSEAKGRPVDTDFLFEIYLESVQRHKSERHLFISTKKHRGDRLL